MVQQSAPRKACDLCYNKRIKCDGQKPVCSHCVIYKWECTHTAARRKTSARRQGSSKVEQAHLQSRLEDLETRLSEALQNISKLEGRVPELSGSPIISSPPARNLAGGEAGVFETRHHRASMELPPLPEVLLAAEKYLTTSNSVLPLFHAETLLKSIHNWYRYPDQRDCASWAAINVVLALASRGSNPRDMFSTKPTAEYLNRAQSVLTEVTMRGVGLINVQVLAGPLGTTRGPGHGTAYDAGGHRSAPSTQPRPPKPQQLCVSGCLRCTAAEPDISMRIKQAPLQQDIDIDLDLPPEEPDEDEAGFVGSADGRVRVNFFRARVQLARIQGCLYDCLYSVRAQTRPEARADNMTRIRRMLDDWTANVPQSFTPDAVARACPPGMARYFGILYGTRLSCLSLVSLAHSWDARWMENLQDYGCRAATGNAAMPVPLEAPLPQGWETLVSESRGFLKLAMSIEGKDAAFVWMTACAYVSGLVCLTANNMCQPNHGNLELDRRLADMALLHVGELVLQTSHEPLRRIGDACKELVRYDRMVVHQGQRDDGVVAGQVLSDEVLPFCFVENGANEHVYGQREAVTMLGPLYISA